MVQVSPVVDRRSLRQFINHPYKRYRHHPYWVPPLRLAEWGQFNPKKNPFYQIADVQLFTARDAGRMVGRIAAIDNRRHNEFHHENVAAFGFFEADSAEVARALLGEVEDWARARGRSSVRGPLNPSLNYSAGLQIDAFDTVPYLMMPWNPPEYPRLVEEAGYRSIKELYCWRIHREQAPQARLSALADRIRRRHNVVVRPIDRRRGLRDEAKRIEAVYSTAWLGTWGFVPPTPEEFWHIFTELQRIAIFDMALLAEVDGRPVGCAIVIPDLNQALKPTGGRLFPLGLVRLLLLHRIATRARIVLTGVIDEYRNTGVLPLLMYEVLKALVKHGFDEAEGSWTMDDNDAVNLALKQGGASRYKTYRLYEKDLAQ